MSRFVFALLLVSFGTLAQAQSCSVAGRAYDPAGKPLHDAVVRVVNQQTGQSAFGVTDAQAGYHITAAGGGDLYRVDLLGNATEVTGSHVRTRSIVGMSADFACRGTAQQDVRALE